MAETERMKIKNKTGQANPFMEYYGIA